MAAFLLVEEDDIGPELRRKRQGLRFTLVEVALEGQHQRLAKDLVADDPRRLFHFLASRMTPAPMIELAPDRVGDVDLPVELPKQLEVTDGGEVGKRRGVADDDHCPL